MSWRLKITAVIMLLLFVNFISNHYVFNQHSKQLEDVRNELNPYLQYRACIREGPFPFSSLEAKMKGSRYKPGRTCEKCELLAHAGLLTKNIAEYEIPPSEEYPNGDTVYEVVYDLSELGRAHYIEGASDSVYELNTHRFCFGKARIDKFTRIIGPERIGMTVYTTFRYIAVLDNPSPYLKDPRAKLLDIEIPEGDPLRYKESYTTAVLGPNGEIERLDSSMQIIF